MPLVGTLAISLAAGPAAAAIDCSNTVTYGGSVTATDSYYHDGETGKPCIRLLGGTLNLNGHSLSCAVDLFGPNNCGVAVQIDNTASVATVRNGIFGGGFVAAVAVDDPAGKTVTATDNTIDLFNIFAVGLRDVQRASGNVIKSTFLGTAIQWAPTAPTNYVRDNYISCAACTYGIRDVSTSGGMADIEKNFIETPNGNPLWVPGSRDIANNILIGTLNSGLSFGTSRVANNLCNADLREIDSSPGLCANHDPLAPFNLP